MTTLRQAIIKYNSYRPHKWYTLEEVVSAYRKMQTNEPIETRNTKKQYFRIVGAKHRWNEKIVSCDLKPNESGMVKIWFTGKSDHVHQKFLKPCKPQLGTLQQQSL